MQFVLAFDFLIYNRPSYISWVRSLTFNLWRFEIDTFSAFSMPAANAHYCKHKVFTWGDRLQIKSKLWKDVTFLIQNNMFMFLLGSIARAFLFNRANFHFISSNEWKIIKQSVMHTTMPKINVRLTPIRDC